MKKNVLKLNEEQMRMFVAESVGRVLNEISADLAFQTKSRSEDQIRCIDELENMCDRLLEKLNELFYGNGAGVTPLSPKIARGLDVDGFSSELQRFVSGLRNVSDRKWSNYNDSVSIYNKKANDEYDRTHGKM